MRSIPRIALVDAAGTRRTDTSELQARCDQLVHARAELRRELDATREGLRSLAAKREREAKEHGELLARERIARAQLEKANGAKDRFISILSHDLRGPINAVLGWAHLLRREPLAADARDRALATIERSMRMQLALVEELLDLSRLASGKLQLELVTIDLARLVAAIVETFSATAREKSLDLRRIGNETDVVVFVDRRRLEQVITNLVVNALKFTPDGGRVEVAVRREAAEAVVRVTDTGCGIDRRRLSRLFENVDAFENVSTTRDGLGLGLYIVKRLVVLHGGSVDAQSEGPGHGATFTVQLPLGNASSRTLPSSERSPAGKVANLAGMRVLIVDDDDDAREILGVLLRAHGADVALAPDAATALEIADAHEPHVMVSDIALPGADGFALLHQVRERVPRIAAIGVSGYADATDATRAMNAGFNAYFTKPIDSKRLLQAIAGVMARNSQRT